MNTKRTTTTYVLQRATREDPTWTVVSTYTDLDVAAAVCASFNADRPEHAYRVVKETATMIIRTKVLAL